MHVGIHYYFAFIVRINLWKNNKKKTEKERMRTAGYRYPPPPPISVPIIITQFLSS